MSAIYKRYQAKGLEVLMAAVNTDPRVDDFVRRFQVAFPVGMANGDRAREFFQLPLVAPNYVPWFVVIDKTGMIRTQHTGGDQWFFNGGEPPILKEIEPLLAAKAPAAAPAPKKK